MAKVAKKKVKKNVQSGIAHIQSTFNNTIVTITDVSGNVVAWSSAGVRGFKGSRKSTPFAAQLAAEDAAKKAMDHGMRSISVFVNGPGSGRESALRAFAASETSESYKRFATPTFGRPHRDFYYNVTYEAVAYASGTWDARGLAISHLSRCGRFHEDIATCNAEALAHYCDQHPAALDSFTFVGCCISQQHLAGISRLNSESHTGKHRPILKQLEERDGHVLIHLEWSRDA